MTTTARDIRYGRRGGRWIDADDPPPPATCDVCGEPIYTGTRHVACTPPPDDNPPTLLEL